LRSTETTEATIHRYLEEIAVLPLTDAMAVESSYMPVDLLPDPMDRIIAATARSEGIPLVTADQRVQNCTLLKTIRYVMRLAS
jgi:PIN domain nuclease of toxin-antitoxin system